MDEMCIHEWYASLDANKYVCALCGSLSDKSAVDLLAALLDQHAHRESSDCWCGPTLNYVDPETGVEHWIHHKAS